MKMKLYCRLSPKTKYFDIIVNIFQYDQFAMTDVSTLILSTNISDFLSFYTIFHFRVGIIKVETSGNDFINGTRIRLHVEYFKKSLKISKGSSGTVYFLSS